MGRLSQIREEADEVEWGELGRVEKGCERESKKLYSVVSDDCWQSRSYKGICRYRCPQLQRECNHTSLKVFSNIEDEPRGIGVQVLIVNSEGEVFVRRDEDGHKTEAQCVLEFTK